MRPAATRDLKALPAGVRKRVEPAVDGLSHNPRPPGCKKLLGFDNEWRLRVGSYRILYLIDDSAQVVTIARIAHRREAYR
ncbi:MAG TPA: type II toxin-antitoxin system RelE/ParE family toxin [Terriglobia bacterium]|nr:type II toxin-antitoxin system RelE/ParE family toxin [Terriglobia bacterium]